MTYAAHLGMPDLTPIQADTLASLARAADGTGAPCPRIISELVAMGLAEQYAEDNTVRVLPWPYGVETWGARIVTRLTTKGRCTLTAYGKLQGNGEGE